MRYDNYYNDVIDLLLFEQSYYWGGGGVMILRT